MKFTNIGRNIAIIAIILMNLLALWRILCSEGATSVEHPFLIIFGIDLGLLLIGSGIELYYLSLAVEFYFSQDTLHLIYYYGKHREIPMASIVRIRVSAQRYTFETDTGKKYYLGRMTGPFSMEVTINKEFIKQFPQLLDQYT